MLLHILRSLVITQHPPLIAYRLINFYGSPLSKVLSSLKNLVLVIFLIHNIWYIAGIQQLIGGVVWKEVRPNSQVQVFILARHHSTTNECFEINNIKQKYQTLETEDLTVLWSWIKPTSGKMFQASLNSTKEKIHSNNPLENSPNRMFMREVIYSSSFDS